MDEIRTIASTLLRRGKVFDVVVDDVEYPSGRHGEREVAVHPGGAAVVALTDEGHLLLVRQYRYPFRQRVLEIPAGKLQPGEDPLHCAQRELQEETGYAAGTWQRMVSIYTAPGFSNETLHLFLARNLKPAPGGQALEEGEATLTVEVVPFDVALTMIEYGDIMDAKTICGVMLAEKKITKAT